MSEESEQKGDALLASAKTAIQNQKCPVDENTLNINNNNNCHSFPVQCFHVKVQYKY